jgi:hypothetical protein
MHRLRASIGRCDVCDLEAAAWSGGGVRLCEACCDWKVRRPVREGAAGLEPLPLLIGMNQKSAAAEREGRMAVGAGAARVLPR